MTVDVTKWKDLCQFFRLTKETYGRIDHVFCNAGVSARADYLDDSVDDEGDPVEPSRLTFEINLMAAINTATLAIWYMRKQERGGSIVLNSSASGMLRFLVFSPCQGAGTEVDGSSGYVRFDSADYGKSHANYQSSAIRGEVSS